MIATERFVFVHMHKTGGQTINKIISRCFRHHQVLGYHYPFSALPSGFEQLPLVGFARNPWDWYVSWYAFNRRPKSQNALFSVCSNGGKADFKTTISNLVNLGDDSDTSRRYRSALVSVFPENLGDNRGVGLTKDCIRNFQDNEMGYCSWLFDRMLGGAPPEHLRLGRFENLQDDFLGVLRKLEVPETEAVERAFSSTLPENASRHGHYSQYYDKGLRDLVANKDYKLIEQFGYGFEEHRAAGKAIDLPDTYAIDGSFRKLLDKSDNYLLLSDHFDVAGLARKLEQIPADQWTGSGREQRHAAHNQTQSLLLVHDQDNRHQNPTYHEPYQQFKQELEPLLDLVADYYQRDGYFIRLLFARLLAASSIVPHIDATFTLLHCHRVHIPVISNEKVIFSVGGEDKVLKVGEIWEINNATVHAVTNKSDEPRVHLIADWVPNSTRYALEDRRRSRQQETGRNEPCRCGSGLRFKNCHGSLV